MTTLILSILGRKITKDKIQKSTKFQTENLNVNKMETSRSSGAVYDC